jgi:hypothetical protein
MSYLWRCLDNIHGLGGVPALWRSWLGGEFAIFERAFLERRAEPASSYPCPQECGCEHDLVERTDGNFVAVCTCDPWNCDDFAVLRDEAALLELNWPRLGRAISKAFDCDYRETDLHLPLTRQIGSKFANAVPVVLTVQNDRDDFRQVVAGVVAQLGKPFILLGPTSRFVDANSIGLLHGARAEFFDLASHVTLLPGGMLQARKSGGELFSRFLPQTGEPASDDEARRLFALMEALESESNYRKAPVTRVFQLYCKDGLSRDEVARQCHCVPSLITARLQAIERKLGRKPSELRQFSSQFERISDSLSDDRAAHIHRKNAMDDSESDSED